MLFMQILQIMRIIHEKTIVHRDIKPDNFLFGYGDKSNQVFAVDFGLANQYIVDDNHIPFRERFFLTGTAKYASLNAHKGYELSRRDDLEAVGLMMLNFVIGSLPWDDTYCDNLTRMFPGIGSQKELVMIENMCKNLPP